MRLIDDKISFLCDIFYWNVSKRSGWPYLFITFFERLWKIESNGEKKQYFDRAVNAEKPKEIVRFRL